MKPQSLPAMQVVKRDEKEVKLTEFILREIASGRVILNGQWCVLALTMDSPVIAALQRVLRDLDGAPDLELRIILAARCKKAGPHSFANLKDVDVRTAKCARLLDGHEQLVLGETSSWTGDCMRRNPRERDAFETFGAADRQLAQWAAISFERIWAGAAPSNGEARSLEQRAALLKQALAGELAGSKMPTLATSRN